VPEKFGVVTGGGRTGVAQGVNSSTSGTVHALAARRIGYNVALHCGVHPKLRLRLRWHLGAAAVGGASPPADDKETNVLHLSDRWVGLLPRLRPVMLAFVWGALAGAVHAQGTAQEDLSGFKATPLEIAQLPRYCWGTFDPKWTKPGMAEFNLPGGCGERFNHFCPGVLSLQRAKGSLADAKRRSYWLGVAQGHIRYTVDGLANVNTCPMKPTVAAMAEQIRVMKSSGQ
jgi:hypothetical protein